jgi:hypothetical protein
MLRALLARVSFWYGVRYLALGFRLVAIYVGAIRGTRTLCLLETRRGPLNFAYDIALSICNDQRKRSQRKDRMLPLTFSHLRLD